MALTLVLSVGLDPELLGTRNLVLQSAGYTVVRAYSLKAAVECFQTLDFDLVLLCETISAKDRDRLTSWIRAGGSRIPVVAAAEKPSQDAAFAGVTVGSDPDALLAGLRKALNNLALPAARTAMSRDEQELAAARKKPPRASAGYDGQAPGDQEQFAPLSRRSAEATDLIYFPKHDANYARGNGSGKSTQHSPKELLPRGL